MKTFFLILCSIISVGMASAQDFSDLKDFKFANKEQYKEQELTVMQCAEYVLTTPTDKPDPDRQAAFQFIMKWMNGTPDYKFPMEPFSVEMTRNRPDLLAIYLTSMAQTVLKNRDIANDGKAMQLASVKRFIAYCEDRSHGVRSSGYLKKLMKANEANELETFLGL